MGKEIHLQLYDAYYVLGVNYLRLGNVKDALYNFRTVLEIHFEEGKDKSNLKIAFIYEIVGEILNDELKDSK